ncbi:ABC transporter related [Hymenobacter roseosalivarius DSM 11622]|uniref:ABC transporter related n=1 Tax=Hymenobacter roseosalivarius DSM 11622 TaxID=645990 RepID=A0A1W1UVI6_9BACT|nr:ABC transporter ATP-binding protein [Hymenobacter roseosalivarius]SMB85060.1 ABC transporter related [Hymenobacter roseosalivarius DSM 11622]
MVHVHNMSFGYSKKYLLFENLNLSLTRGHIYGLLGKNGAGKSTLLKNMIGLAFPQAGTCQINGQPAAKRLPSVLEDLYFLPEEIYVPALTAEQFVKHTAGFYPQFQQAELHRYLREFEVPWGAILDRLSFGQQKKFMIAFGLATNTGLFVMDEPTNGLDIPSKVQFRKIMASALTEERCMIISTHQVRDLDSLIDTVVVLHDRKIVLNQGLDQVAERLTFTTHSTTDGLDVLYAENSVRGQQVILPNTDGRYSRVDLELLFNALISNKSSVLQHLNQPEYEKSF